MLEMWNSRIRLCLCICAGLVGLNFGQAWAQTVTWEQTNGPFGGTINALIIEASGDILAGGGGIFRSNDSGDSWNNISMGLRNIRVLAFAVRDRDIWIGSANRGILYSRDEGKTWREMNNGVPPDKYIEVLAINDNGDIFAGSISHGILRSTDNGESWVELDIKLTDRYVLALAVHADGSIFAGTWSNGVFRSTNNGLTWVQANTGLPETGFNALDMAITPNGNLFLGTSRGVFRSGDMGENWSLVRGGIGLAVFVLTITSDDHILAGTIDGDVFRSIDGGDNWTRIRSDPYKKTVLALAVNAANDVFAGTGSGGGVYRSTDSGQTWQRTNAGLTGITVRAMANNNDIIYAGVDFEGIYRSKDEGDSWDLVLPNYSPSSFSVGPAGLIWAGAGLNGRGRGLVKSSDQGETWEQVNHEIVKALAIDYQGTVFVGNNNGVYRSWDGGVSWEQVNSGLEPFGLHIAALAVNDDGDIFAGTSRGLFRSQDRADTWQLVLDIRVFSFTIDDNGVVYAGSGNERVFRSIDNGAHWSKNHEVQFRGDVISLETNGTGDLFVGTNGNGVFLSRPQEQTWTKLDDGLRYSTVNALVTNERDRLFAGSKGGGIFRSVTSTTRVETNAYTELPVLFTLSQNYPNPFNPTTTIDYTLKRASSVTIELFNITGRRVRVLLALTRPAGEYTIRWDGKDDDGRPVAAGLYLIRFSVGDLVESKKMVLLR